MIIACNNCNKKFIVESSVIPEIGRLLQCSACNHKWFFKKKNNNIDNVSIATKYPNKSIQNPEVENPKDIKLFNEISRQETSIKKSSIKDKSNNVVDAGKNLVNIKKNYNVLGKIVVFIISFIALIIILDTFQNPIGQFVPNIEFILYNLYESIKDLILFFKDLI